MRLVFSIGNKVRGKKKKEKRDRVEILTAQHSFFCFENEKKTRRSIWQQHRVINNATFIFLLEII
jgi:hypothetical protein